MPAPKEIIELVERFERNIEEYKLGRYNEAQVRQEFINPFFEALGWDMNNRQGLAEAYKEVIHEDSIKVGMGTKAPDYCFRIGGTRKFFLEAKNPSVNIRDNIDPSYQIRRYAWSAKLPLSILTDFEEFSVYDTRIKPKKNDKASTARILYFTFRDYIDKWDEIASIFSRDAIVKGSFDKYVESTKKKRGTAEVDVEFLDEIEKWRAELAKDIAKNNRKISQSNLNYSIQKIIDRIIFLRICEDRGIEDYGKLQALLNGAHAYQRLCEDFERADQKYNSGLFHFKTEKDIAENPDEITLKLKVSDDAVKSIIRNLYFPDSPYEFSVITADILGKVYEQFLGKVIRLTKGHRVVIEEKPEVRKAGGVYYTPVYIVDYIVKNTVGKLLEGKTPEQASKLKILDPACGSGSFLIGAYQLLLDWHLEWYINNNPKEWAMKKKPAVYQSTHGGWKLTITERKRILLNNIHGVDIDPQAVEVTKLSLLLKVLEGDVDPYLKQQLSMSFMTERALPDLGSNIKCGNSLIGPDFYEGKNLSLFGAEEMEKINTFDWYSKEKGFGEIMSKGGFDAVIGNPPYVRQEFLSEFKKHFESHYKVYQGAADLYAYFIEKGIGLLKKGGLFSYIVANKWMRASYGSLLRDFLKKEGLLEIVDFGDLRVFENATTYPCIVKVKKGALQRTITAANIESIEFSDLSEYVKDKSFSVDLSGLPSDGWTLVDKKTVHLLNKLRESGITLGDYVENKIYRGVLTGLNEAFIINEDIKNRLIKADSKNAEIIKPFLTGSGIKRYEEPSIDKYLIFTRRGIDIDKYRAIKKYLSQFQKKLEPGTGRKPGSYKWYEIQDTVAYYKEFEKAKIMYQVFQVKPAFIYDNRNTYANNAIWILPGNNICVLGIMNSKLGWFMISHICTQIQNGYQLIWDYLKNVPIPNMKDVKLTTKLEIAINQMLETQKQLHSTKHENDKKQYQHKIEILDKQIDDLVYKLYGLTEEEIRVVEGAG